MIIADEVRKMLIEELEKRGEKYEIIEAKANISKSTISRIKTGKSVSMESVNKLVAYLEIGQKYREIVGEDLQKSGCHVAEELFQDVEEQRQRFDRKIAELQEEHEKKLAAKDAFYAEHIEELRTHYEDRLQLLRDQNAIQAAERERERITQQETYKISTDYLKNQIAEMKEQNKTLVDRAIKAEERAAKIDSKRHNVFWGMLLVVVLLLVAVIIFMGQDSIF